MTFNADRAFQTLDFSADVIFLTEGFVGRRWLFEVVDKWVQGSGERLLLISGGPGIGKSAFAARLTQTRRDVKAFHFCVAGRGGTLNPIAIVRSICAQLCDNVAGFQTALLVTAAPNYAISGTANVGKMSGGQAVGVVIQSLEAGVNADDVLQTCLRAPLQRMQPPTEPIVILIDALDESLGYQAKPNLVGLLENANDFPAWVRLVCTTRPKDEVTLHLGGPQTAVIALESNENQADVWTYLFDRLGGVLESQEELERVRRVVDGNFLYAKLLIDGVGSADKLTEQLKTLPKGLDQYYVGLLWRLCHGTWDELHELLLSALAVAQEPLTEEQLAGIVGIKQTAARRILIELRPVLKSGASASRLPWYALFHESFRGFLFSASSGAFRVVPIEAHGLLADYYFHGPTARAYDRKPLDAYALRWLSDHLVKARRYDDLRRLLLDFNYLLSKLIATDSNVLIADYGYFSDDADLSLIRGAIRLSASTIARAPAQFASQLVGRLLSYIGTSAVRNFTQTVTYTAPRPWLRPLLPALQAPGTGLVRTLSGHALGVKSVAVTPDGRWAVSASSDRTLKVWELESGRELQTLSGHALGVKSVAVTPDGRWAVSASSDRTLKVWELESGRELQTLSGHADGVNAVAVTPDGRRAVSASGDRTLRVWDIESGRELQTLSGHADGVNAVAVTPDGRRAVSASYDRTVKVWELDSGRELQSLPGHAYGVRAVAVTPDGRRAISGSSDRTLKIWELKSGRELQTLFTNYWIHAVTVTPDGRHAISASDDSQLKVWDIDSGAMIATFCCDADVVCCAVAKDGIIVTGDAGGRVFSLALETG